MRDAILRSLVVSALVLVAGCATPPPGDPALPIALARPVDVGVWRGAQPDAAGLAALRARGFRTIIDLRAGHDERAAVDAHGMRPVAIPIVAALASEPPTDDQVRRFFEVVLDPEDRPVLFHCAHGRDRTGMFAALYRIEVQGWSNADALAEMRALGFRAWYRDLEGFVAGYRRRGYSAGR